MSTFATEPTFSTSKFLPYQYPEAVVSVAVEAGLATPDNVNFFLTNATLIASAATTSTLGSKVVTLSMWALQQKGIVSTRLPSPLRKVQTRCCQ